MYNNYSYSELKFCLRVVPRFFWRLGEKRQVHWHLGGWRFLMWPRSAHDDEAES